MACRVFTEVTAAHRGCRAGRKSTPAPLTEWQFHAQQREIGGGGGNKCVDRHNTLLGRYAAQAMRIPSTLNYKVNDMHVYDHALASIPERQNASGGVFGQSTQSPSQVISFDADTNKAVPNQPVNQISMTEKRPDSVFLKNSN